MALSSSSGRPAAPWFDVGLAAQTERLEATVLRERVLVPQRTPPLVLSLLPRSQSGGCWMRLAAGWRVEGDVHAALGALPFAPGSLSRVCVQHVHEACVDPARLLAEVAQLLHPGGRLLVLGYNRWGWSRRRLQGGFLRPVHLCTPAWVRGELRRAGLELDATRGLPWPDSRLEPRLPVGLQTGYVLNATLRPPAELPLRPFRVPAGAVPG